MQRVDCDYVAGCDGYHGVSRHRSRHRCFGPTKELSVRLAWHHVGRRRFPISVTAITAAALRWRRCAIRCSAAIIQCDLDTKRRTGRTTAFGRNSRHAVPRIWPTASSSDRDRKVNIAPLRSFVAEPMRYGRCFWPATPLTCPPTGAKGLNLAVSDVFYLSRALTQVYHPEASATRHLFRHGVTPGMGRRAHVVVADDAPALLSRRVAIRRTDAA